MAHVIPVSEEIASARKEMCWKDTFSWEFSPAGQKILSMHTGTMCPRYVLKQFHYPAASQSQLDISDWELDSQSSNRCKVVYR